MTQEPRNPGLMGRLMDWMGANCRNTNPFISESLDHPLPFSRWWRLKLHLALCEACRFYLDQLRVIQKLARRLGKEDNGLDGPRRLRPEFKEQLKQTLKTP